MSRSPTNLHHIREHSANACLDNGVDIFLVEDVLSLEVNHCWLSAGQKPKTDLSRICKYSSAKAPLSVKVGKNGAKKR